MGNLIAITVIVIILGSAIGYIVKAKKSGVHCIGCPAGGSCSGHCSEEYKMEQSDVVLVKDETTECGCKGGTGCNCTTTEACSCK